MKVLVGTFNQEKALLGAFSVIVKTDGSFAALIKYYCTSHMPATAPGPQTATPPPPARPLATAHWQLRQSPCAGRRPS